MGLHPGQQQSSHRTDAKLLVVVCTCRAEVFQDVVNLDIATLLVFSEICIGIVLRTNLTDNERNLDGRQSDAFLGFGTAWEPAWLALGRFAAPAWRSDCGAGWSNWLALGGAGGVWRSDGIDMCWDFGVADFFSGCGR